MRIQCRSEKLLDFPTSSNYKVWIVSELDYFMLVPVPYHVYRYRFNPTGHEHVLKINKKGRGLEINIILVCPGTGSSSRRCGVAHFILKKHVPVILLPTWFVGTNCLPVKNFVITSWELNSDSISELLKKGSKYYTATLIPIKFQTNFFPLKNPLKILKITGNANVFLYHIGTG
jgi:hypothetical protein